MEITKYLNCKFAIQFVTIESCDFDFEIQLSVEFCIVKFDIYDSFARYESLKKKKPQLWSVKFSNSKDESLHLKSYSNELNFNGFYYIFFF